MDETSAPVLETVRDKAKTGYLWVPTRSAPLVAAFGDWLQVERRNISNKSRLREKLTCIHSHWNGLQTLPTDGRVETDSDQDRKPDPTNRKNTLFAGHDEGGIAWGRIASLIETCKINGVKPFAYPKTKRQAIAAYHPKAASTICSRETSARQAEHSEPPS